MREKVEKAQQSIARTKDKFRYNEKIPTKYVYLPYTSVFDLG